MFWQSKLVILSLMVFNFMHGACGFCKEDALPSDTSNQVKSKVNTLVMSVPKDGIIDGLVITSCGKCNLGTDDRSCSLSAKIGETIYPVKGTSVHDHGDEHSSTGFCSAVRVAWVKGKLRKNVLHTDSFVLVGD